MNTYCVLFRPPAQTAPRHSGPASGLPCTCLPRSHSKCKPIWVLPPCEPQGRHDPGLGPPARVLATLLILEKHLSPVGP